MPPGLLVRLVKQGLQVSQDLQVRLDRQELRVSPVLQGQRVKQVPPVLLVRREPQA